MVNEQKELTNIYNSLRGDFVIIGLTGALGSGCSKVAEILEQKNFPKLFCNDPVNYIKLISSEFKNEKIMSDFLETFRAKQLIKFYKKAINNWKPFQVIKGGYLLEALLVYIYNKPGMSGLQSEFKNQFRNREKAILENFLDKYKDDLKNTKNIKKVNEFINALEEYKSNSDKKTVEEIVRKGIISRCINSSDKNSELHLYYLKRILQEFGRFLRKNGNKICDLKVEPVFWIVELIRRCIKILSRDNKGRFVIDSLKSPFEIEFFRNRYSNFYLFSILATGKVREKRLDEKFKKKNSGDTQKLQEVEKKRAGSEKELGEQDINLCIGKGDIFINNDDISITLLTYQLGKYIALILNPGLVTPTKDEIFMQIAFTARYASGCISRQVGAVVTGEEGYVRGIGWNDVPEGQIPCLYRSLKELKDTNDTSNNPIFSNYELSKEFKDFALTKFQYSKDKEWNKGFPFCFKDIQNQKEVNEKLKDVKEKLKFLKLDGKIGGDVENMLEDVIRDFKKFKNPTRERALHAEENAFLQAAKVGGMSVINGTLYSTDFPCQLCSKKSRQLFIKRIVYIDDYPDISKEHTLCSGTKKERPKIEMFSGAIGQAYFKLYAPFIPRKNELKLIS